MADFSLRKESCEETIVYPTRSVSFEDGSSQRAIISDLNIGGFRIRSPKMTKVQYKQYRDHFIGQFGALTSFLFTSPFETAEVLVCYVENSWQGQVRGGSFTATFELQRVYE